MKVMFKGTENYLYKSDFKGLRTIYIKVMSEGTDNYLYESDV